MCCVNLPASLVYLAVRKKNSACSCHASFTFSYTAVPGTYKSTRNHNDGIQKRVRKDCADCRCPLFSGDYVRLLIRSFFLSHFYFVSSLWTSYGLRCRPFSPRHVPSVLIAHRVQHSHCSLIFIECCYLALCARQFVRKKKSRRIYTSMHSGGLELTQLLSRHDDNLLRTPPGPPSTYICVSVLL